MRGARGRRCTALAATFALLILTPLVTAAPPAPPKAVEARATGGMVATVHPLATAAGVEALRRGGNAVDAAVAAALTLGVVDGHNSGIGGGCFMLIRTPDGTIFALDGREMAPAAATRDMFVRDGAARTDLSQTGALASGVPGSLAVYADALARAGRLTLADALLPAADLAETGFKIDANYARKLSLTAPKIRLFPETARILLLPDGSPPPEGHTLRQPDLARTYRAVAAGGPDAFYKGDVARKVGDWMAAHGGLLTAADFAAYTVARRTPVTSTYRGYTIVGMPPPSSGGVHVAQILNLLERFDLAALERQSPALRVHVTAEAMKLAFADRAWWLGDPDFVQVPTGLTDKAYAARRAERISLTHATPVTTHGDPPGPPFPPFPPFPASPPADVGEKHTTHIAAADADGYWVALTATVNTSFGSKVIVPGTGVILNNQMDDFAIQPGVANAFGLLGNDNNAVAPRKRPLSSMSPTLVLKDGRPVLTLGAAGGPKIITQVALVLSNVIDLHDPLAAALERPRFHHQNSPPTLWIENTTPPDLLAALRALGHTLDPVDPNGATQAIALENGTFLGISEPRLQGSAAGVDKLPPKK